MTVAAARPRTQFGQLLRYWRGLRGMSQLALATAVGSTPRHVSFLETGRSRPRRDLVTRLADALDVPLRARNEWLDAVGLPAAYPRRALDDAALAPYRRALDHLLAGMEPYPALVLDRSLCVVDASAAARRIFPPLAAPGLNLVDALLAPGPGRDLLANHAQVAWAWHRRLMRDAADDVPGGELARLLARVDGYLRDVPRPRDADGDDLLVCPAFRIDGATIRTIGMTVRFAPGRDLTLQELSIDVMYPRDAAAEAYFRARASS